jgi:tetratricopeptide (TPR) repeat protein
VVGGDYIPYTFSEKWASIIWAMGKYFQLLIFPHPLTHDYYPRYLDVITLTEPSVVLSMIMNACLIFIFLIGIRKKSFISYLILFYYATIALTSNVLFPIGTHLSERFLFIPSLAFCLWLAYCTVMILKKHAQYSYLLVSVLAGSITLMSAKTISRNSVWKDDYTLFTTDVKISKNSAKVRNAAAGATLTRAAKLPDGPEKTELAAIALTHLIKAIEVHPRYKNAHLLMGNAYFYQNKYDDAISAYRNALTLDNGYTEAKDNLFLALREGARFYGSTERNINKAKDYLTQAVKIKPNDYETISLLGIAYGNEGNHRKALEYFEKASELQPNNARAYVNLGYAQLNMGLDEDAQISFQKAIRIDPKAMDK